MRHSKRYSLKKKDYKTAELLLEQERINPVNFEEMFKAGIYCILAQAERYDKQIKIYRRIVKADIVNPKAISERKSELSRILRDSHFPNEKEAKIRKFAAWWVRDSLPIEIIKDMKNGHNRGVELRNALAEKAPSFGYKTASLFMIKCGYDDVIPIDLWVIRFLNDSGYEVDVPDYTSVGGMTKTMYLKFEEILRGLAKKDGVSLAMFQGALWGQNSTWTPRKERKLFL